MKNLAGRRILVTGAAAGIGKAIANALAKQKSDLYLLDVDEPRLIDVARSLRPLGIEVITRQCDLTNSEAVDACLDELLANWNGVDIVVNNAGRIYFGPTDEMTDEQWDMVLATNLLAPAQIIRRLLPSLLARDEAQIVNIASIAGLVGFKRASAYSLTKFGLVGLGESLRIELAKSGVGVVTICPGFVRSRFVQSLMKPPWGLDPVLPYDFLYTTPDVVAQKVIKAIRRNRPLTVITLLAKSLWYIRRFSPTLFVAIFGGLRRKSMHPQYEERRRAA